VNTLALPRVFQLLPEGRAIVFVALTVFIMAYSWMLKAVPIVVFMAIWLPHVFYGRRFVLAPTKGIVFVLLLPLIACYSWFWSEHPGLSIYYGAEFLVMALCATIIARLVSITAFVKGVALGCFFVLASTLADGTRSIDALSQTEALMGLFTSKNMVGLFAEVAIFSAILCQFIKARLWERFVFGLVPFGVGAVCLIMSRSASSVLSLALILGVLALMGLIARRAPAVRTLVFSLVVLALASVAAFVVALEIDLQSILLEAFGKNPNLTGRTELWAYGWQFGAEKPLLGHGYAAFWVQGQPLAEQIWREFHIQARYGFSFHSMFVQSFVDLGVSGLLLVMATLLFMLLRSLFLSLRDGLTLGHAFALAVAVMFAVRSFVEVDWLGPFGIGPLLIMVTVLRLSARETPQPSAPEAAPLR
jgi:exopolysaccharide production protein ExoQ